MKILSTIFYTVFIALIIGIAGLLLGTMLPIPGNIEVKIVKSGSMEPAIPTGSLVVVKPQMPYKKGDVITFGKDTKTDIPTTHRIIALNDTGSYMVKGDANEEADPNPVERSMIIGKVLVHVPFAGFVLDFARQPLGFALLIGIPAGLIIMEELLTIVKEMGKWRRKRDDEDDGEPQREGFSAHLKRVYAKRRAMDEIKVAMFVEPRWYEALWWGERLGLDKDAYGPATTLTLALIFTSTLFAGGSGSTLSYFQDLETSVGNIFRAGTWVEAADPQDIVINEFLPNPDNGANGLFLGTENSDMPLGEWVELYNNGDVPVNVAGWYLSDASGGGGNTHAVIDGTNTQPATTTVPAHGWLVVYMNKPTINNTGESLTLYTNTDVEVDSYTYDVPSQFCEQDPTPGGTNATSTPPSGTPDNGPGGDCTENQVPPNKSIARIPDGTGDFVDPIPTPGAPNIPDPEPLPKPIMTDDLIEDEGAGEVLGAEDAAESEDEKENPAHEEPAQTPAPQGGGGGGGGGSASSPEDPEPAEETIEAPAEEAPAEAPAAEPTPADPPMEPEAESPQSSTDEAIPDPPAEQEPAAETAPEPPAEPPPAEEPPAEQPVVE